MDREQHFQQYLSGPDEAVDLARAALLLAACEYPCLEITAYLERLDRLADRIRGRLPSQADDMDRLIEINRYLFQEQGFAGNGDDYYDPRNSFFNDVLDRRLGIPLTLSVLYMEVGRRLDLQVEGVAFPGHFLVKLHLADGALMLDPFFGGLALSVSDLEKRLGSLLGGGPGGRGFGLSDLLEPAGNKEILGRMLRNLRGVYRRRHELPRALSMANRLLAALPGQPRDWRERGAILEDLDCGRAAARDYRHYLELEPDAADAADIHRRARELETHGPRLN